jgi:hypothetical protein
MADSITFGAPYSIRSLNDGNFDVFSYNMLTTAPSVWSISIKET